VTSTAAAEIEVLNDVYRRFVHLVLYARTGDGTWASDDELTSFHVQLTTPVIVCINDEPDGYHLPHVKRATAQPASRLSPPTSKQRRYSDP
jgi:hypothetical protein